MIGLSDGKRISNLEGRAMTERWPPAVSTCTCACPNHFSQPTRIFYDGIFCRFTKSFFQNIKVRHLFTKKLELLGPGDLTGETSRPPFAHLNTPPPLTMSLDVDERVKRTIMTSSSRRWTGQRLVGRHDTTRVMPHHTVTRTC